MKQQLTVSHEIELQAIQESDARLLFDAIDHNRTYLGRWLPFVASTCEVADSLAFICSLQHKKAEQVFKISYRGKFGGLIGFNMVDSHNLKLEIGYWLIESLQKNGIMTRSVATLVDYAFSELAINRVQINCAAANVASQKIPQRLGFILEGIQRDGILLADGHFIDCQIYSMLKREWKRL
ncbi:GNAT family N-acetyltransferase [Testudinibacter sp. TR-2022]|uniref:GNAT family N-acetyltransferase n=1 Tax=Testudinibacter sp. TR-2022 TaxID=2585029 RepID=UPI00111B59B7|nr:GNAT family protein [Testudinibacter sp. TR-2022]TNH03144.1 GNAT family N-acetyltransferase [Pasteurellaceae bacterium Phil31]TNH10866.1 GNAT family N-acetyltransferase [Testudinibacter sp. TR-2022]TNH12237.1 GNAT family N-acetyltransferase [Testudinibacter sp. TR-2022]TNH15353.1 GNAT family N-acetyltransferase [Testudinibacter sp. TR-2022]